MPITGTGVLTNQAVKCNGQGGTPPVVTPATTVVPLSLTKTQLTILGNGFNLTSNKNSVVFSSGVGFVTKATAASLFVAFVVQPQLGPITAVVTANGLSSGSPVQVGVIVAPPTVDKNVTPIGSDELILTITGHNFSTDPTKNSVSLGRGAIGTVVASTENELVIVITSPPIDAGVMTAVVTSNGLSSGKPVEVAVIYLSPVVNFSSANIPQSAATLVINGANFSVTKASLTSTPSPVARLSAAAIALNNIVVLSSGSGQAIAVSPDGTQLTIALLEIPDLGPLMANLIVQVKHGVYLTSGDPVEVANVASPVAVVYPAARIMQVADAFTDELNATFAAVGIIAEAIRKYSVQYAIDELQTLHVDVQMATLEETNLNRGTVQNLYGITVTVQQQVDPSDTTTIDYLANLIIAIYEHWRHEDHPGGITTVSLIDKAALIYSPTLLQQNKRYYGTVSFVFLEDVAR